MEITYEVTLTYHHDPGDGEPPSPTPEDVEIAVAQWLNAHGFPATTSQEMARYFMIEVSCERKG